MKRGPKSVFDERVRNTINGLTQHYWEKRQYGDLALLQSALAEAAKSALGANHPFAAHSIAGLARLQATCPAPEIRNLAEAVRNATTVCEITEWKNLSILTYWQ